MTEKELEKKIIAAIKTKRHLPKSFVDLVEGFEEKFSSFNPLGNCFDICHYFGTGTGQVATTKRLILDNRIQEDWLKEYFTKSGKRKKDFKGLYVFIHDDTPFYVGISKGVIGRILQHTKGHNHNTSTLAFRIGLMRYEFMSGQKHLGRRMDLNFKSEVAPIKQFLLKQKIAFLPIENEEELYLFEIFCSMKLQTGLNTFETH